MSRTSRKQLAEVLYELLKDVKDKQRLVQEVADYLVAERRTNELEAILRELERLRSERDGLTEAVITSARPINESIKHIVKEVLGIKNALLIEKHDEDLVGGVRIQTLDTQLDLSIRGQLNRLKSMRN